MLQTWWGCLQKRHLMNWFNKQDEESTRNPTEVPSNLHPTSAPVSHFILWPWPADRRKIITKHFFKLIKKSKHRFVSVATTSLESLLANNSKKLALAWREV